MIRTRESYREIELYDPKRTPCTIDLSDNTNLFGVPPALTKLLADPPTRVITRYPSVFADELKRALAQWHGVVPENITTGCGSDDVIDSALRAFCEPGDRVVYPVPTFGVVKTFTRMNAAVPLEVPYRSDFSVDANALIEAAGTVTYLCSPNNPTGTEAAAASIKSLDEALPGVLLLDEAYAHFSDADYATFAAASVRTVSLRTFSKACGLAGLRVGYAIGPSAVIHEIEKSRGPYKVNAIAEAAATAVISEDSGWIAEVIEQTRTNRERLGKELSRLGVTHWPTAGNFVLIKLPQPLTAGDANSALRARGVAVRPFPGVLHAGECLRVTIGPWPMMETFLESLKTILAA